MSISNNGYIGYKPTYAVQNAQKKESNVYTVADTPAVDKVKAVASLSGKELIDALEKANIDTKMVVANGWLNDAGSGFITLARAILVVCAQDNADGLKAPAYGKVPLENVAATFSQKMGASGVYAISKGEYNKKSTLELVRQSVLYRWNEKNGGAATTEFKGILQSAESNADAESIF